MMFYSSDAGLQTCAPSACALAFCASLRTKQQEARLPVGHIFTPRSCDLDRLSASCTPLFHAISLFIQAKSGKFAAEIDEKTAILLMIFNENRQ